MASLNAPTYKELIELLEENMDAASLRTEFIARYPHIAIPRADRFLSTCQRIAAPYQANSFSSTEALNKYMQTTWTPRVRNAPKGHSPYPQYLEGNGLSESMLFQLLFDETHEFNWTIPDTCPSNTFYSYLHPFLKSSEKTKNCTKTCVGQFYCRIDPFMSERNFRPDNAFRYVERLVTRSKGFFDSATSAADSDKSGKSNSDAILHSSIADTRVDESTIGTCDPPHVIESSSNWAPDATSVKRNQEEPSYKRRNVVRREYRKDCKIEHLKLKLKDKIAELHSARKSIKKGVKMINTLSEKVIAVTTELNAAYKSLQKAENELSLLKKKADTMDKAFQMIDDDFQFSERAIEDLQDENKKLKEVISSIDNDPVESVQPIIATKAGKHYALPIRRLYYELLAKQVPASRVSDLVKSVVKCFFPDVDVSKLQLPKESCAGYMRREELYTVEMSHKAHHFCSQIESKEPFHLNTDGTTLHQHKIYGIAINDVVFSLNEVPDGSAESAIQDIEKELNKLRSIATKLQLPFANSINWTLFASSTSDSASTQKKFNNLLEERIECDRVKFGSYEGNGLDLIRNFCAMHLGVNLRKAFIQAICKSPCNLSENLHQSTEVDTFIHEFAKLFGAHGTPEYCIGNVKFPDFIQIQTQSTQSSDSEYFKQCSTVHLERQVGSRYFVTAANASKALFLAHAALEFLKFNGVSDCDGNKLAKGLYLKLQDTSLIVCLRADALMFYFIYADLVTLAKSSELNKSAYDMRIHYLELKTFLEEVEEHPEIISEKDRQVFISEPELYSSSSKVNHRLRNECIWEHLFTESSFDETLLSIISAGATSMKTKLMSYASSYLPGGEFWEPDPDIRTVLSTIKPTNDICESILGLNDYLSTAIPNLDQAARSTLVAVKKNKTIKWLDDLPESKQDDITLLAMKSRHQVKALHKKEQDELQLKRQELMLRAKNRREFLEKKAAMEREKLSKIHVITSVVELERAFIDIDSSDSSTRQKSAKKMKILREQVAVRRKLLNQKIKMKFSKKQLKVLIDEFKDIISNNPCSQSGTASIGEERSSGYNPLGLVGRHISHKFIDEDSQEEVWYEGYIVGYNAATRMHELAYVEEDENFFYDLTDDLHDGDIVFFDEEDD